MSAAIAALLLAAGTPATDASLDQTRARWEGVASQIWEFSEPSLQETKSANLTAELLEKEGFKNEMSIGTRLALSAIEVEFFGKTSHAAASPWLGRSALDALELFEHAMSLMCEHVLPTARIHRVIKDGGKAADGAHPVGFLGMHVAAKVLGASLVDLLADRNLVAQAKEEFAKATQGKPYVGPLPADARLTVF